MDPDSSFGLISNLSVQDFKTVNNTGTSAIRNMAQGLDSFGFLNDKALGYLTIATSAMQITAGMASLIILAQTAMESRKAKEIVAAAAATAVNSTTPIGWGKIALATGAAAVASAALTSIALGKFDLSTTSGRANAISAVEGAMA